MRVEFSTGIFALGFAAAPSKTLLYIPFHLGPVSFETAECKEGDFKPGLAKLEMRVQTSGTK